MTALRPAPDGGDGIELRLVNLAEGPRTGTIELRLPLTSVEETGLDGSPLASLQPERLPDGLRLSVTLGAKEIRTVRLR
ncbi:glycosyl hydrolase-related protein [Cohnella rhizosphaerae]|uniref:Glycosyl hydrolase-related protein n=1 Tax=Cohnella rhizosphaerae TaxID=1457232 RepID=A0A9X4KSA1_9BACL|nr:glycosyl hydrolase-related protein [Cohnella rhizosphaerae]MDG0810246.1 glycosyl hydrolase-related protein [Cohnella rhizosphaerae]